MEKPTELTPAECAAREKEWEASEAAKALNALEDMIEYAATEAAQGFAREAVKRWRNVEKLRAEFLLLVRGW